MSKTSYKILEFLKEHNGSTAKQVADALEMEKRRVDSYFSASIQKAELGFRNTENSPATLHLNNAGMNYKQ